jgi:riboflavin biosynthesis pyrimidine reductase
MAMAWRGPGEPFTVLCYDDVTRGCSLPTAAQAIYGDWSLPEFADRPYVFTNFVVSRDGRVSFSVPGAAGGAAVSGFNKHDRWLMGLLRARADAVLIGDNTLRAEPEHCWSAQWICSDDAAAFTALRRDEGRAPAPLLVIASYHGEIAAHAIVFGMPDQRILIATTERGARRARQLLGHLPSVTYAPLGEHSADLAALKRLLFRDHGVRSLLCEGGPTLYGSLLQADQTDDEFLTLSPIVIGSTPDGPARPSLVEGVGFAPAGPPTSRLLAVRRAGDYLFLHSRYSQG